MICRATAVPAHHTVQEYVDAYLEAARICEDRRAPLPELQARAARRAPGAGDVAGERVQDDQAPRPTSGPTGRNLRPQLPGNRDTEYLRNGRDLEVAARIAVHESTRTTQLYNRLREEISLDEIERIHI